MAQENILRRFSVLVLRLLRVFPCCSAHVRNMRFSLSCSFLFLLLFAFWCRREDLVER